MIKGRYHEDRRITANDLAELETVASSFTGCSFTECDLAGTSFRGSHFTECTFDRCDLSNAVLQDVLLHSVTFAACRLIGVGFAALRRDPIGLTATFEGCDLSLSGFEELDLRGCAFRGNRLSEAAFRQCDLRGVDLRDNDFVGATFGGNDLREADLRGARNYAISPYENKLRGLRVELPEALELIRALGVDISG